jgi:hypothetical protein
MYKCPRYTEKEICVKNFEYDEEGNIVKESSIMQYESMTCDHRCALYDYRPHCIKE